MKVYAKTGYDGCSYITAGRLYDVVDECEETGEFWIVDDDGDMATCNWFEDFAMKGNDWQRVEIEKGDQQC